MTGPAEINRTRCQAYRDRLRAQVFGHYGWSCSCCGTARDLTIDHLDGRGREHRLELFGDRDRCGRDFYIWLVGHGFPRGYQVLCRPCGSSKSNGPACRLDHTESQAA